MQVLFFAYVVYFFKNTGRLPPPFFYNSMDTFMDFYNTNFWAFDSARFEEWRSIYPIIVFGFSKLFTSASCLGLGGPFVLRACDTFSIWLLFIVYTVGIWASAEVILSQLKRHGIELETWGAGVLYVGLALAMPGLFALERGNYIILAFMFLAMATCLGDRWQSAILLMLAINIKQYLVVLLLVPFLKRQWGYVTLALAFGIAINLLGLIVVPEPRYDLLIDNMLGFSSGEEISYFEKIWNPTSILAWEKAILFSPHMSNYFVDRGLSQFIAAAAVLSVWIVHGISIWVFLLLLAKSKSLSPQYMSLVLLMLLMINTDAIGGYAIIFLLPFLASVCSRPNGLVCLVLLVGLFMPIEIPLGPGITSTEFSHLGQVQSNEVLRVTLGAILRPLVLLALLAVTWVDLGCPNELSRFKPTECSI